MKNWKYSLLPVLGAVLLPSTGHSQALQDSLLLFLTGASSMEELDESEIERWESLLVRPVRINTASRASLRSCGLFDERQVESIISWREKYGGFLSPLELSLADGFDERSVSLISGVLSFEGGGGTVPDGGGKLSVDASSRVSVKESGVSARAKAKLDYGGLWSVSANSKGAFNLVFNGTDRLPLKVVAGDFYARFGQGLALWNGFSLSGLSQTSSFEKRPAGISPACSYSSNSFRGVACTAEFGRVAVSAMGSWGGGDLYAVNVSWTGKADEQGLTLTLDGQGGLVAAVDSRLTVGPVDFFSELSADVEGNCLAGLAGVRYKFDYKVNVIALARYYPVSYSVRTAGAVRTATKCSDEYGASIGFQYGDRSLTIDAVRHQSGKSPQVRAVLNLPVKLGDRWTFSLRANERHRSGEERKDRADLRADLTLSSGKWRGDIRAETVLGGKLSALASVEAGFVAERFYAYVALVAYDVLGWDDRIYVYQRGAPGSFNMRMYYGRGFSWAAVCKYQMGRSHRFYLRWTDKEISVQYSMAF